MTPPKPAPSKEAVELADTFARDLLRRNWINNQMARIPGRTNAAWLSLWLTKLKGYFEPLLDAALRAERERALEKLKAVAHAPARRPVIRINRIRAAIDAELRALAQPETKGGGR